MTFKEKLDAFLFGMAKAFDLGNMLRRHPKGSKFPRFKYKPMTVEEAFEADRKAIESDWKVVGEDMRKAFTVFEKEITNQKDEKP
jgi:hypothetical protein